MATIDQELEAWRLSGGKGLDPLTKRFLKTENVAYAPYNVSQENIPSTAMGLASPEYYLARTPEPGTLAFTYETSQKYPTVGGSQAMFITPKATSRAKENIAHETEHLLARQNLPQGVTFNQMFDRLMGVSDAKTRNKLSTNLVSAVPHLEKKYGFQPNTYFSSDTLKRYKRPGDLLSEQFATLSALEQVNNVDLTKDPELRKTIFADPAVRETFRAMTGLRQTRTDPRDLPPYTRIKESELVPSSVYPPEPAPGFLDRLKGLLF